MHRGGEAVGAVRAGEVLRRLQRLDDVLGLGGAGALDRVEQQRGAVVAADDVARHGRLRARRIGAPPAVGAVFRLVGIDEVLGRGRQRVLCQRGDHGAARAEHQLARAFHVGLRQPAGGGVERLAHVQPHHVLADHRQVGAKPDDHHRVRAETLQPHELRGHVLVALVVGLVGDLRVLVQSQDLGLDQRLPGDAVAGALMDDADLLELLRQRLADDGRLGIVLDRGREHVRPRRLVEAVRIHDRGGLRLMVHHRPAVGCDHVHHGEGGAGAGGADEPDDVLVVENAAHVLHRAVGHQLIVQRLAELDLLAEHAAGAVALLDRQDHAAMHALAEFVERTGQRRGQADLDGVFGACRTGPDDARQCQRCRCGQQ